MKEYRIETRGVSKKFRRLSLFRDISFELKGGSSFAITGPNGSGKSTLLQIMAGIQAPTKGNVDRLENELSLELTVFHRLLGFVSPLIHLYGECTGIENIEFALGSSDSRERADELLQYFGLMGHEKKVLKTWSSGMQQRLKLICALAKSPPFLFLDEPGTNLDRSGKKLLYDRIDAMKKEALVIIATNEPEEIALCGEVLNLGT